MSYWVLNSEQLDQALLHYEQSNVKRQGESTVKRNVEAIWDFLHSESAIDAGILFENGQRVGHDHD